MTRWDKTTTKTKHEAAGARGDSRPPGIDRTERQVEHLFGSVLQAKKRASSTEGMEHVRSRIAYKLAQRLDSGGYAQLAQEVAVISQSKPGVWSRFVAGLRARTASQWLRSGIGGGLAVVAMFAGCMFVLVWYRGGDVPLLNNFSEQSTPIIALTKQKETEYGVTIGENSFDISTQDDVQFRSLGISNKVEVTPEIEVRVELSSDMSTMSVVPQDDLEPGTEYTVTLKKGTMFNNGTSLAQDLSWRFRTEPVFAVTGITPRDGSTSAPVDTTIEVEFTYKDVDPQEFSRYFEIVPAVSGTFELYGKKIVFVPEKSLAQQSVYQVTVKKGFQNSRGDALTQDTVSTFTVSSMDSSGKYVQQPRLWWNDWSPVVNTTQDPWVSMESYNLAGVVNFTLYTAKPESIIETMHGYSGDFYELPDPSHLTKEREFSRSADAIGFFPIDLGGYGIYLLEAYSTQYSRPLYKYYVYTPLGVLVSDAQNTNKVWLYNMNSKVPIGGGTIEYYDLDAFDDPVYSKTTSSDGYAVYGKGGVDVVIAESLGSYAVALVNYSPLIWGGGLGSLEDQAFRTFLYVDKPLYRPGDTVNFKVVVWEENDMAYSIPDSRTITIKLGNSGFLWDGRLELPLYEQEMQLSGDYGTAEGSFVLSAATEPGDHALSVSVDGVAVGSQSLIVAAYDKPKTMYALTVDKERALPGDTVQISIAGTDYTGDPAAGEQVSLRINKSSAADANWVDDEGQLDPSVMQYSGDSSVVDTTLRLDTNGRVTYTLIVSGTGDRRGYAKYAISVFSRTTYLTYASAAVIVADAPTTLSARAEVWWVGEGSDTSVTFRTADVWDFKKEGGVRIEYAVERQWTEWVQDGTYYDPITKTQKPLYDQERHTGLVLENQEVTTDDDGLAQIALQDLDYGTYAVHATYYPGTTGVSRVFRTLFYVFELPEGGADIYNDWDYQNQKFKIYLDKEEYTVGETAKISIKTTLTGKGVYQVIRGDVYEWRTVDFSDGMVSIQQDLTSSMAPWTYVCVYGVDEFITSDNPAQQITQQYLTNVFTSQCSSVVVNQDTGRLVVSVTSDKDVYEPGDEVSLDIKVSDRAGRGAEAEVLVDVVDKSLLDVAKPWYWTNSDIHRTFYSLVREVARTISEPSGYATTGGYGGGGGNEETVRSNFADVGYWDGKVQTDASGHATITFSLPDNLTTWTVRAIGVGKDQWVGEGRTEFMSRKDIRLDTNLPQFLRSSDQWDMDLEVANFSSGTAKGTVTVLCEQCEGSSFSKSVSLSARTRQVVEVLLEPKSGQQTITIDASFDSGSKVYDAVRWSVPVIPVGFGHNVTQSALFEHGDTEGTLTVSIPADGDVSRALLQVTASKSFINEWAIVPVDPTVTSSIDLSSSIMHNSLLYQYYDQIRPQEQKSMIGQRISSALDLLAQNQAESGGYGWFDYDAVNYETSAYVGLAYGLAEEAGISLESSRYANLELYLWRGLESDETSIDEKILGIYALATMGDTSVLPYALDLKSDSSQFADSPLNVAHLMLALQALGSSGDAGELIPLLSETASRTERSATWQDGDTPFRVLRTVDYTTAVVYQALSAYDGFGLTELARTWLVDNPVSVSGNSVDAVGIFYALAVSNLDNLAGRGGVDKVTVMVNGHAVRTFDVGGNDEWVGKVELTVPSDYLQSGTNEVAIQRDGDGELYVIGNLTYYSEEIGGAQEFSVDSAVTDFDSGASVVSVKKGDVVTIRTAVTVDRDGFNLVVRNFLPSGFEPVQYEIGNFDYNLMRKWWKWDSGCCCGRSSVNRYGTIAQDYVTFTQYQVKAGSTYTFEYPAIAAHTGMFSGGGAQAYLLGFGDVGGYDMTADIEVEN